MTPTPDWTIAELRPHTSATSRRMIPSSQLSRSHRWSRRSRLRGGRSPAIRIQGPHIGSSRRIALSMTPRLLVLPGSGPLRSCINGLSKRSRCVGAPRPCLIRCPRASAVRRDDRHARKRPARLSQHAVEWPPLERPKRPPTALGIRSILVYYLSHTLLARLVSHRLT